MPGETQIVPVASTESYYRARYYDPTTGRFISEDPIRSRTSAYAYARNRPMVFRDPRGLKPAGGPCLNEAVSDWIECLVASNIVIGGSEGTCLAACLLTGPGWPECAAGCTAVMGGIEDAALMICTAAAAGEYYDCKIHGTCKNKK